MIRHATASDRDRVLLMARDFHRAAGLPFAFCPVTASMLFDAALHDDDRLCLVYERADGAPVGTLCAYAGPHMFAPVKVAQEIMFWIAPEHRGRGARGMMQAYEAWARSRGCALVHMVGLGADPVTTAFYQRLGYEPAERHFFKALG